ncbi:preprotein translocase subunit SecA [Candidatus Dojkabacteria bacterium]|nr:preprotein translocase subunit SecA [Candidatus Dojkabacteria bacterium]
MFLNIFSKFFDSNEKQIKAAWPIVEKINSLEPDFEKKDIKSFQKRLDTIRNELNTLVEKVPSEDKMSIKTPEKGKDMPQYEKAIQDKLLEFLPEVYAMIREVSKRKMRKGKKFIRQFDVQLLASAILAQGFKLVELKTGEGKTLVFQMPAALYSLTGRGSHVVTVNDYLAKRDGEYAGHILSELGFSVGVITPEKSYKYITDEQIKEFKNEEAYKQRKKIKVMNPGDSDGLNLLEVSKQEAYKCDVIYGTNNEFGFDYLRDNMVRTTEDIVQGELYFCIVDEADSILVDEARTPLIISAPAEQSNELYIKFAKLVKNLEPERHYVLDEKAHSSVLTDEGIEKAEKLLGVKNIWEDYRLAHHLENALKAETLYKLDDHYLVRDGEVMIVDEFTGRVLAGRRYSEGLHQAIEAKEGVEIKRESKTLATITFQNLFRLYKVLSGGSGTVMTEAEEFFKIYSLDSLSIPTNKPIIRKDLPDRVYKNQEAKFNAIAEEVTEKNKDGQPVLIGTTSIEKSEYLSRLLDKKGVDHEVLNAKYHEREANIVANAGKKSAVTVATNMAGRGTDIKLGGFNATDKEFEEVVKTGGLQIIGSERHEARRIDNQLRGRSGRQGEPGVSRFYVALDDEIMRIQGGPIVQKLMEMTNIPEDMPIESGMISGAIENAQKRMEGTNFDVRKQLVQYDDVVNKQREIYYKKRRTILEETDHLAALYKKEEILKTKEKTMKLTERLQRLLEEEVDFIVNKHFIPERSDDLDRKQVIADFLDLFEDELVTKIPTKKKLTDATKAGEYLEMEIEGKKLNEITSYLKDLVGRMLRVKVEEYGKDYPLIVKNYYLESMDHGWTEHLDSMTDLRQGIGLRGYAQREPLVEYKNEGFLLFEQFIGNVDSNFARIILKIKRILQKTQESVSTNISQIENILIEDREMQTKQQPNDLKIKQKKEGKYLQRGKQQDTTTKLKIGRNDPCPCGSGLKYKKCGLINAKEHKTF